MFPKPLRPAVLSALLILALAPPCESQTTGRIEPLQSYSGRSVRGVDTSTLTGNVMTGYQGWFNCEGTAIFKCTNEPPVGAEPFLAEPLGASHLFKRTQFFIRFF